MYTFYFTTNTYTAIFTTTTPHTHTHERMAVSSFNGLLIKS